VSNVAIWDARKAMEWVHTHIGRFGGDAERVTNWGFSAGGSQVMCSLTVSGDGLPLPAPQLSPISERRMVS
jgi:carboxylesterase type B